MYVHRKQRYLSEVVRKTPTAKGAQDIYAEDHGAAYATLQFPAERSFLGLAHLSTAPHAFPLRPSPDSSAL